MNLPFNFREKCPADIALYCARRHGTVARYIARENSALFVLQFENISDVKVQDVQSGVQGIAQRGKDLLTAKTREEP